MGNCLISAKSGPQTSYLHPRCFPRQLSERLRRAETFPELERWVASAAGEIGAYAPALVAAAQGVFDAGAVAALFAGNERIEWSQKAVAACLANPATAAAVPERARARWPVVDAEAARAKARAPTDTCVVCLDAAASVIAFPCLHTTLCEACAPAFLAKTREHFAAAPGCTICREPLRALIVISANGKPAVLCYV